MTSSLIGLQGWIIVIPAWHVGGLWLYGKIGLIFITVGCFHSRMVILKHLHEICTLFALAIKDILPTANLKLEPDRCITTLLYIFARSTSNLMAYPVTSLLSLIHFTTTCLIYLRRLCHCNHIICTTQVTSFTLNIQSSPVIKIFDALSVIKGNCLMELSNTSYKPESSVESTNN